MSLTNYFETVGHSDRWKMRGAIKERNMANHSHDLIKAEGLSLIWQN